MALTHLNNQRYEERKLKATERIELTKKKKETKQTTTDNKKSIRR